MKDLHLKETMSHIRNGLKNIPISETPPEIIDRYDLEKDLNKVLDKSRELVKKYPIHETRNVRDKIKEALYWLKIKPEI